MRISFFRGALFCAVLFVFFSCSNEIYGPDFHSDSQPDSNGHVQKEVRVIDINDLEGKYLVHYSEDENTLWLSHRHVSDGNLEHCSIDFSTNKFYVEKTPFRRNDDGSICYGFERVYNDSKEQYEWECSLLRAEQYNESLIYLRRGFWHDHAGIYSNEENPENVLFDASRCFDGSLQYFEENEVYVVKNSAARIRFYPNGPDEDYEEYIWPVGEKLQIPDIKYDFGVEIDGYDFYGWSENPEAEGYDVRSYTFCTFDRDMDFYPVLAHDVSYTITFDANGSDFYIRSTQETQHTVTQVLSGKTTNGRISGYIRNLWDRGFSMWHREGYTHVGWATTPDSDVVEYTENSSGGHITLSGDITLYAVWSCKKYLTVKFNANGGSPERTVQAFETTGLEYATEIPPIEGTLAKFENLNISRPGYRFRGWALESDAEDVLYEDGASITLTKDIELFALWDKEVTYTVTFVKNTNDSYITTETQSITGTELTGVHGKLLTADELGLRRPYGDDLGYYQFTGWAVTPVGSAVYGNGGMIELTGDTTLYATWYLPTYTVKYYSGNSCYHTMTVRGYKTNIRLKSPNDLGISKSGYTFNGWKADYDSYVCSSGELFEVTCDTNIRADWIENCFWIQLYYPGSQHGESLTAMAYALSGSNLDVSGAWSFNREKRGTYSPVVKISSKTKQAAWTATYTYVMNDGTTGYSITSGSRNFVIGNHYIINVADGTMSIN